MMRPLGDRRARVRFEIIGALRGMVEFSEAASIVNISGTGALIESPLAVPVDSMQSVRLTVEGTEVALDARVRHLRPLSGPEAPRYLVGLEFVSPPMSFVYSVDRMGRHSGGP